MNAMEEILNGVRAVQHEKLDLQIVDALHEHLFGTTFDLAALNIQCGRDVGLGSINEFCKTLKLKDHETLAKMTGEEIVSNILNDLYDADTKNKKSRAC